MDFQDTQRGKFPREWNIRRFNELLTLEYGKGLAEQRRMQGTFPVVGSNGIVGYHNTAIVKGPGIVVGRKGTIGAVTWIDSDFWPIDTTYYVKTKKNDVCLRWLFYELVHLSLPRLSQADVVPGLKRESVHSLVVALPPLAEQQKIAEILGAVDSAIELVDRVIWKTERLKKGLMQTLLTKGIGHTEYKDTPIGKTPKTWQIVRLSNVGDIATGKTPSTSNTAYWNGKIPFITPADIKESKYVYETERYVTSEGAECVGGILPRDTVLAVCIGSTIGKTAITYEESVTNQQINSIICKKDVAEPDYVYYALSLRANLLKSYSGVAAVPIVKKSLFEQFKIPLPPIPEQQRIAETLSVIGQKLELERKEKMRLERVKRGLMNLLLNGKVRVKVD
jgi:type I restriction enzyme S subunit